MKKILITLIFGLFLILVGCEKGSVLPDLDPVIDPTPTVNLTVEISALPTTTTVGNAIQLRWITTGGDKTYLNGDEVAPKDTIEVILTEAGNITFIVSTKKGNVEKFDEVVVNVQPKPEPEPEPTRIDTIKTILCHAPLKYIKNVSLDYGEFSISEKEKRRIWKFNEDGSIIITDPLTGKIDNSVYSIPDKNHLTYLGLTDSIVSISNDKIELYYSREGVDPQTGQLIKNIDPGIRTYLFIKPE